ncbi:hypothetical protein [Actinokineospora sp. NPDC004072]
MFRRALAPAAVLLLAVGCSGRANDLYTYYDEPTTTARPTPAQAAVVATTAAPTTTATTAATTTTPAVDPGEGLLTDADLAEEGVESAEGTVVISTGCGPRADASWVYPTGSTIDQSVHVLPGAGATLADLRAAGTCLPPADETTTDGPDLPELGDDRYTWCFTEADRRGCGAVIASGDLASVVVVEAGSVDRAAQAITRIAPLAAAALD